MLTKRTIGDMSAVMLYQISGMGKKTIETVMKRYSSLAELMEVMERHAGRPEEAARVLQHEANVTFKKALQLANVLATEF